MRNKNRAFTLIELLVVIAIIAMLVSILSVAQRKVRIISKNLRQKAAFHAGEVSLELYSKDFGDYPDSKRVFNGGTFVTGSQRLAEAFFGRDDRGFNPKSKWHPAFDTVGLYGSATLKDRKKPYFERKRVGFHTIYDLWDHQNGTSLIYDAGVISAGVGPDKTGLSPVFTDVFTRNKVPHVDEKVGMPVLYFKADPTKRFRVDSAGNSVNPVTNAMQNEYKKWVYNFNDNIEILKLPWLRDTDAQPNGLALHYPDEDNDSTAEEPVQVFYEKITQREDGSFYKPYNKNTFLLISAGYDGIYGTKDDLTNFGN